MTDPFLRLFEDPVKKEVEREVIQTFLPETVEILRNPIRAGIVHLLVNSPNTGHSMKVEQLAYKFGTYHRIIIYHLEKLQNWKLVTVKKSSSYGKKTKRSIWGLDLKYPNWVLEVYSSIQQAFEKDNIEEIYNKNINIRGDTSRVEKGVGKGVGGRRPVFLS